LKEAKTVKTTPSAAYTPGMMLDLLGFATALLLILFGITLIGVGGFYFFQIIRECFRAKPVVALEKKAAVAMQAADLGWLAIVCGPVFGVAIFSLVLLGTLFLGPPPEGRFEIPKLLVIMVGVGAVAGAITAGAFWASSALLGNVRKAAKRLRGVRDPEFDGPF
jgi:hypothetical protein